MTRCDPPWCDIRVFTRAARRLGLTSSGSFLGPWRGPSAGMAEDVGEIVVTGFGNLVN